MTDFGGSEAGKKGGRARADALTPEERRDIARKAALARWDVDAPEATHEGSFKIGDATIFAAVLPDGTRLLSQGTFLYAIGRSRNPKAGTGVLNTLDDLPSFLQADVLKPFVPKELEVSTRPVFFRMKNGEKAVGYNAEVLPHVAEVYLKMRDGLALQHKSVPHQFRHIVTACDVVMRALARVAIAALVDEATGYQDVRARDALAKLLEKFVAKEIQHIVKCFPLEYYKGLCKLWNIPFSPDMKMPRFFGHLTNNIVYARLAPAVLEEIQRKNPVVNGRRKTKHYKWLTKDVGHPKVQQLLGSICTIMDFADGDKGRFWEMLDRRHPKYKDLPLFRGMDLD
jgi:P63C domain